MATTATPACGEAPDPLGSSAQTIAELHARSEQEVSKQQRRLEVLTANLGRPGFFYLLLGLVVLWIAVNLLVPLLHYHSFDRPPFSWLQGLIGLLSLLLTTTVLITQNRQGKIAERRALLDLHINLLAEQKVTKLIALVEELRRDLPQVHDRADPQAEAMARPVDAHAAIATLEQHMEGAIERKLEQRVEEETAEVAEDVLGSPGP